MIKYISIIGALLASFTHASSTKSEAKQIQFKKPEPLGIKDLSSIEGFTIIDFDGDGHQDLVSSNITGCIFYRKNKGVTKAGTVHQYDERLILRPAGRSLKFQHT